MNMPKNRFTLLVATLGALALAPLTHAADSGATAHANKGVQYSSQGAFDQAIQEFTEAIKINPNDARFYKDRGGVYLTT
jgi:Flp pilus assembly protein TadD